MTHNQLIGNDRNRADDFNISCAFLGTGCQQRCARGVGIHHVSLVRMWADRATSRSPPSRGLNECRTVHGSSRFRPTHCRHMQQPIYWPAALPSDDRTYQKAYDSLRLQKQQGGHPKSDIDGIFGKGTNSLHQWYFQRVCMRTLVQHAHMCDKCRTLVDN